MSNTVKLNNCPRCGAPIPADAPQGLCPKCVLLGAATSVESGHAPTATSEIPTIARLAAAFPQLEIIELIGRGGMGFVFKARQPHLDRFVALKLLPDKLARDPRFAERFGREGRVLAKLNHPNIVSVYDFGSTEHFYFLLMEYVDGVNLRQAMQAGRFSPGEALAIVPRICEALQYAHGQGILHRDIKPENILLDARGQIKIADFGIAKLVGDEKPDVTLTATGAALGTPHYMAPEQLEKPSEVDHRADIYSLGVVFYEMLTGELPIGRFAAPSSKTPVGTSVDEVVFRTLEKDRELRFQSAREMQTQVEHLTSTGAGTGASSLPPAAIDSAAVARPAKALLATGIVNWAGSIVVVCLLAFTGLGRVWPIAPAEMGVVCILILALSSLIIVGGLKMLRLESYPLAVVGSVVAMITSPGSIVGLPVGIWSLMTLLRSDVRAAFRRRQSGTTPSKPTGVNAVVSGWSRKAVWSAVLTGLSLPTPILLLVLAYLGAGGLGVWELGIGLGVVSLPGLSGFILGWMAISDIRAHQGRLRGLPLAVFSALTWPLALLVGGTLVAPWFIALRTASPGADVSVRTLPMLLVMAGTITFALWAVHATVRWAGNQPASRQRGVLKWVFLGLLLAGLGVILLPNLIRSGAAQMRTGGADGTNSPALEVNPMIQFTFTAVELRDEGGARWLAMDYVQQTRGECERTFRYVAQVPGFTAQTRMTAFLSDAKAGFEPVLHQRVAWKLPESLPEADALALRDLVGREWIGKSAAIEAGDERVLFKTLVPNGGSLVTVLGVKLQDANQRRASRLEYLLKREQELVRVYTPEHPVLKDTRRQIAELQQELKRLNPTP